MADSKFATKIAGLRTTFISLELMKFEWYKLMLIMKMMCALQ